MDGKRIGYKGNVFVRVPYSMTVDYAEHLLAMEDADAPLPDNVRAAVERLVAYTLDRSADDEDLAAAMLVQTHLQEKP
jgi:hypothetical protein